VLLRRKKENCRSDQVYLKKGLADDRGALKKPDRHGRAGGKTSTRHPSPKEEKTLRNDKTPKQTDSEVKVTVDERGAHLTTN